MNSKAAYWIKMLGLLPHPEGGFYRETYRSAETVKNSDGAIKSASTAIYFLLQADDVSALHRIDSDEIWHFYDGGALAVPAFYPDGSVEEKILGIRAENGEILQRVVPAGCWFGAYLKEPGSFALVGCTVAPGFEFKDLEFADREDLLRKYPGQHDLISRLIPSK